MQLLVACIADDITGASDLALMLAKLGMPTTLCLGVREDFSGLQTPAIVNALKIHTIPAGNIGPVTNALLELLHEEPTVLLPAFPENGRTVSKGELSVKGVPLSESPMRHHPLTPMTDSSLLRLMDAQTSPGSTGLGPQSIVDEGADEIRTALEEFRIGPQIDPGVPWMYTPGDPTLCVAFKSGNFGAPNFFQKALDMLP